MIQSSAAHLHETTDLRQQYFSISCYRSENMFSSVNYGIFIQIFIFLQINSNLLWAGKQTRVSLKIQPDAQTLNAKYWLHKEKVIFEPETCFCLIFCHHVENPFDRPHRGVAKTFFQTFDQLPRATSIEKIVLQRVAAMLFGISLFDWALIVLGMACCAIIVAILVRLWIKITAVRFTANVSSIDFC